MVKRLLASLIDYNIVLFIIQVPQMIILYLVGKDFFYMFDELMNLNIIFSFLLMLCKDLVFKNASVGKRIMGLEIINKNGNIPSSIVIILRNITIVIWPIEILLLIIFKRRVGDFIFNTTVCKKKNN